jgi:hypothetical protein
VPLFETFPPPDTVLAFTIPGVVKSQVIVAVSVSTLSFDKFGSEEPTMYSAFSGVITSGTTAPCHAVEEENRNADRPEAKDVMATPL